MLIRNNLFEKKKVCGIQVEKYANEVNGFFSEVMYQASNTKTIKKKKIKENNLNLYSKHVFKIKINSFLNTN